MKAVVLFVVFATLAFCQATVLLKKTQKITHCLRVNSNDAYRTFLDSFPIGIQGPVVFSVTAQYNLGVCLQQYVNPNTYAECNPSGKIEFNVTNNMETMDSFASSVLDFDNYHKSNKRTPAELHYYEKPVVKPVFLRNGAYFIYARFETSNSKANGTSCFTLEYSFNVCPNAPYQGGLNCTAVKNLTSNDVIPVGPKQDLDFIFAIRRFTGWVKLIFEDYKPSDVVSECNPNLSIFVRRGNVPYEGVYDVQANCENGQLVASFYSPLEDQYFVQVKNSAASSSAVKAYLDVKECGAVAYGPNCTKVDTDNNLTNQNGKPVLKKYRSGVDYDFYLLEKNELIAGVGFQRKNDKDTTVAPDILASLDSLPTNDSFILKASSNQVNLLWATSLSSAGHWYIAVPVVRDYYVWANAQCPGNCSGHGQCEPETGLCTCNKHYKKTLACDKKSFPVVWIVIIAIAGAIILAVAIGVPVACYVKNKNKARYERV